MRFLKPIFFVRTKKGSAISLLALFRLSILCVKNQSRMIYLTRSSLLFFSPCPPETLITNGVLVVIILACSCSSSCCPGTDCGRAHQALSWRPLGIKPTEASQGGCRQGWGSSRAPALGKEVAETSVILAQHPICHNDDPSSWEPPPPSNKNTHWEAAFPQNQSGSYFLPTSISPRAQVQ